MSPAPNTMGEASWDEPAEGQQPGVEVGLGTGVAAGEAEEEEEPRVKTEMGVESGGWARGEEEARGEARGEKEVEGWAGEGGEAGWGAERQDGEVGVGEEAGWGTGGHERVAGPMHSPQTFAASVAQHEEGPGSGQQCSLASLAAWRQGTSNSPLGELAFIRRIQQVWGGGICLSVLKQPLP